MQRSMDDDAWLTVLVDDDIHAARMFVRTFSTTDGSGLKWLGGAARATRLLRQRHDDKARTFPSLIVVDLKTGSQASLDFISTIRPITCASGAVVVVLSPTLDRPVRDALRIAGAAAVFQRHSELAAFRHEVSDIISFWARHQRLDAVGA